MITFNHDLSDYEITARFEPAISIFHQRRQPEPQTAATQTDKTDNRNQHHNLTTAAPATAVNITRPPDIFTTVAGPQTAALFFLKPGPDQDLHLEEYDLSG